MKGLRKMSLCAAACVLALVSTSVSAVSPSAVMVYGGTAVAQPVILQPASPADFGAFLLLWWNADSYSRPTPIAPELWRGLADRPYVDLAVFWGKYERDELRPENASQHGRLYLPIGSEPGIVVSTIPDTQKKARPVPTQLDRFAAAWVLSSEDLATLKGLGVPVS